MEFTPISPQAMQQALDILEKEGIIHDENTLLSKARMKYNKSNIIQDFYNMGYEGNLTTHAKYFPDVGEIFAIYDMDVFGENIREVDKYLTNYVNKRYRGL
ncbi:hypothetical protein [Bacillus subtilis]|uniref:hypothetical protein n=1 Tax=Bacillus subtilis TaxID=1423 RepID=UPI00138A2572|nr:hypothetical protein [Bacillus subtilis]